MQRRDKTIDIMRGLAIILMIIGHSGLGDPYRKFIYLFHMAAFFMISGYLFNPKYEGFVKDTGTYIWKKIKSLWFPCFLWSVIYTLLNNVFISVNIYSTTPFAALSGSTEAHAVMSLKDMSKNIIKALAMSGSTEMGGAFWFLKTLFAVSIIFFLFDYILHLLIKKESLKDVLNGIFATGLLLLGWYCALNGIITMGIPVVLSAYSLYLLGYIVKRYGLVKYLGKWYSALVAAAVLIICTGYGPSISVGNNSYWQPWYLILNAVAGFALLYFMASLLKKLSVMDFISVIGQHTMAIVILHFLSFKLVSLIQIEVYGHDAKYLALFPTFNTNGFWWIAYTIVGIAIPVLLDICWKKCWKKVRS